MKLNPYFVDNIVNLNTNCFICRDNEDTNPKNLPAVNGVNLARLDLGDTFDLKCSELSINEHGRYSVDRPLTGETVLWG